MNLPLAVHFMKKTSDGKMGVESGINANYVPICVVKPIGLDANSGSIPGSQN